jgi:hypothetical protein
MKDKLVITLICASAIAVALAAPSRAQGVIATHRLSAALAAEAVTEAVATCAKQGYHVAATIIDTDDPTLPAGNCCIAKGSDKARFG